MSYHYDLFFSYAHADNLPRNPGELGWISAFRLELDHAIRDHGSPSEYKISFIDREHIHSGADWERDIREGIRNSALLLAFVSPNYLASEWCRKEWEFYVQHEHARQIGGQGVHPIYFVKVPDFDNPADGPAQALDTELKRWVDDLRARQYRIDLTPWIERGIEVFREVELRRQISDLEHHLYDLIHTFRAAAAAEAGKGTAFKVRSGHFVGRRREIRDLSLLIAAGGVGVLTAVNGWPGVGKTAIASEYAHSHAARYSVGSWVLRCAGKDKLVLALEDLLTDLAIDFTDAERRDAELKVRRVFLELEKRRHPTEHNPHPACLLIFDNVDQSALLAASEMNQLPRASWLHLLVTTRLGPADLPTIPTSQFLPIEELNEEDALRLIENLQENRRFRSEDERQATREIVKSLRRLALEVEAVAAYLGTNTDLTCRAFQQRLAAKGLAEVEAVGDEASQLMLHRGRRLSLVFGEMFATLTEQEMHILDCAALLPPDYVALPWLEALARETFPEWLGVEKQAWKKAVRKLLGRRLLSTLGDRAWDGQDRLVRMHRAVQETVRRRDGSGLGQLLIRILALALDRGAFLRTGGQWRQADNQWEVSPLAALAQGTLEDLPVESSAVLDHAANLYESLGDYARAEPLFCLALAARGIVLGEDHPSTLTSLNNLANLYFRQGRYAEAESIYKQAVVDHDRVLGSTHKDTLTCASNFAFLCSRMGRHAAAESLHLEVLAARERVLGEEHPDTLISLNGLANCYEDQGRYDKSERLFWRALTVRERVLGQTHPDTQTSINNLASWYFGQGRYAEAEQLLRRALSALEHDLREDHPYTLSVAANLGSVLGHEGKYTEAERLLTRVLVSSEHTLGPTHPDTLRRINQLGDLFESQERYGEAEVMYGRARATLTQLLGEGHPDTLNSVLHLANLYHRMGRQEGAVALYRHAIAVSEREFGDDHPLTLLSLKSLAQLFYKARLLNAEPLLHRVLSISDRILGEEHPETLETANALAALHYENGRLEKAQLLFLRALEGFTKALGPDHPTTRAVAVNYRCVLERIGG